MHCVMYYEFFLALWLAPKITPFVKHSQMVDFLRLIRMPFFSCHGICIYSVVNLQILFIQRCFWQASSPPSHRSLSFILQPHLSLSVVSAQFHLFCMLLFCIPLSITICFNVLFASKFSYDFRALHLLSSVCCTM